MPEWDAGRDAGREPSREPGQEPGRAADHQPRQEGPAGAAGWFLDFGPRRVALPAGQVIVGRSRSAEVQVRDATVSRNHAILHVEDDRLTVRDLGSSNGTFVNDRRVDAESPVAAGDTLRFGRIRAAAERGSATPTAARPTSVTAGSATPRSPAGSALRFCPACGSQVHRDAEVCPCCGENFRHERPMSRSEAISVSDVMPVGEALAAPSLSLEDTLPPQRGDHLWNPPAADPDGSGEGARRYGEPRYGEPPYGEPEPAAAADETRIGLARPSAEGLPRPTAAPTERLYLPSAGFWPRAAAFLLDLAGPLAAALLAFWLADGPARTAGWVAGAAVLAVTWGALCVSGWSRGGSTPGKAALGLAVCDLDGRPGIGTGRAVARWLAYFLSAVPLGIGFLVAGLSAGHRAFHDRLTSTYVGRLDGFDEAEPGGDSASTATAASATAATKNAPSAEGNARELPSPGDAG